MISICPNEEVQDVKSEVRKGIHNFYQLNSITAYLFVCYASLDTSPFYYLLTLTLTNKQKTLHCTYTLLILYL